VSNIHKSMFKNLWEQESCSWKISDETKSHCEMEKEEVAVRKVDIFFSGKKQPHFSAPSLLLHSSVTRSNPIQYNTMQYDTMPYT